MGWQDRVSTWALRIVAGLIYLFLFGPLLITAAVSFNQVNQSRFPPVGFSLQWWHEALTAKWLTPLWFSLQLSTSVAVVTMLLGLPFAIGLARPNFRGRNALMAISTGPLVLPTMVTGIGLLQLMQFGGARALLGLPALFIGHVVICLPYCVRTVAISLTTLPASVERAAASLGARPIRVFFEVTLPLIKTGIFAGGVFAFIQSFTDYSISLFLARAGAQPITVTILSFLEFGFAPTLAAVAVLTLVVPLIVIAAVQRFFRIGDFIYGAGSRG
jgi:putative spermidine/putrescine transport system permease protein